MSVPCFSEIAAYRGEIPGLRTVSTKHDLIGRRGRMSPLLQRYLTELDFTEPLMILDYGAYDRALGKSLERIERPCVYHSLDVDRSIEHDFYDIDDVDTQYHVISMFELIEHIPFGDMDSILHKVYRLLLPGGLLFLSTPNPSHPTRYFTDISHIQHWPSHDLYAQLRHLGFSAGGIKLYGVIYNEPGFMSSIKSAVRNQIWRIIGLERRSGIFAVAMKNSPCQGSPQ